MSSIPIWVRTFTRNSELDDDKIADEEFRKANFVDYFGKFLQQGSNATLRTFDQLVIVFWNQSKQPNPTVSLSTYVIADGAFVDLDTIRGDWFQPHVRILTVVVPKPDTGAKLFIVGPARVKDPDTFLQVASFDGKIFRFYAYEDINSTPATTGWTYQGSSWDAFASQDSYDHEYLGPFNGHVNGACIMKELHSPWYHWKSGKNTTFLKCIPKDLQTMLEGIPYLTGSGQKCFVGASIKDADTLEAIIEEAVSDWYNTRQVADFSSGPSSDAKPRTNPNNIQRWMAHLLLTTTINIGTSDNDGENFHANQNLFFNSELLSESNNLNLLPDLSQFDFRFDFDMYKQARNTLRLSLLQELRPDDPGPQPPPDLPRLELKEGTLGGGKQTASHDIKYFVDVVSNNEGVPFVILQPSYEDAQGILTMQSLDGLGDGFPSGLLSSKAVRALLMLDFWNPVYSWRRGILMQYVPKQTTLTENTTYDLETNFVSAIRASSFATDKQPDSPEYQFLQLYDRDDNTDAYQTRITNYLQAVNDKLGTKEGLVEYLSLAEARRRIYRPLPLDEFGVQLPYAVNLPRDWHYIEMAETGSTVPIPQRGLDFLTSWTGSLAGFDPHVIPAKNSAATGVTAAMVASRCPVRESSKLRAKRLQSV